MSRKLSDVQIQEVIESYKSGKSAKQIGNQYGVSATSVYGLLKRRNIPRRSYSESARKYSIDENFFDVIDNSNKAYFLGFLMADGYNHEERNVIEVSCSMKDKDILEKLSIAVKSSKPIRYVESNGIKSYRLEMVSKQMSMSLARHGCGQAKTFVIVFPDIPSTLYKDFIRGYFDGDGCISYSFIQSNNIHGSILCGTVRIVGTHLLCKFIAKYLEETMGINTSILCRHPENNNNIRTLQISGNKQVISFMEYIYDNANIWLDRKHRKFENFKEELRKRQEFIHECKTKLINLRDITNNQTEYWNAMYMINHGLVESVTRSKLTEEQAVTLKQELNKCTSNIIPASLVHKEFKKYREQGFPYYNLSYTQFQKGINTLRKAKTNKKDGVYLWGGKNTELATCFHPHIFECRKPGKKSALEIFDDDVIFQEALMKLIALYPSISDSKIREICRNEKRSSRINNFPPRVMMAIVRELCKTYSLENISVLDPCAGFSGRLIGAACSNLVSQYIGIDISQHTYNGLVQTKKWLSSITDMSIDIICDDCLSAIPKFQNCDTIITSPPFLNSEIYLDVPYETDYTKWMDSFVTPFIQASYNSLKVSGIMVLYIEKINKHNFPVDLSNQCLNIGFCQKSSIPFKMSYGENNRAKKKNRNINVLIFQKTGNTLKTGY